MAKRTSKKSQTPESKDVSPTNGDQTVNPENRDKNGRFVKGNNANTGGFQNNPENIDKSGAGMKSRYNKKLLQDMLLLPLDEKAQEQFEALKKLFPNHFNSTEEKNWQFFMELQQLNLVFHKNPAVAQKAMIEIRDRLEGKAVQKVEQELTTKSVPSFLDQFKDKKLEEPKNEE